MKEVKSTFSANNKQTSRHWRIINANCRRLVLQLVSACAKLSLNRSVIRWMPSDSK